MKGEPLRHSEPQGKSPIPQSHDVAGWIRVLSSYEMGIKAGPELMGRVETAANGSADGVIVSTMFFILSKNPLLLNGDAKDGLLSERKRLLYAQQGFVNNAFYRLPPDVTISILSRYPEAVGDAYLALFSHDSTKMGENDQALVEYIRAQSLEKIVETVRHEGSGPEQSISKTWSVFGEQSQLKALTKLMGRDISSFRSTNQRYAVLVNERASELMVIFAGKREYQEEISAAIGTNKGTESLQRGLALNSEDYRGYDFERRILKIRTDTIILLDLLAANLQTQPVVAKLLENEGLRREVERYLLEQRRKARETGDPEQLGQTLKEYLQSRQ